MAWSKNWDMTSYFPEFGGDEYQTHLWELSRRMEQLETLSKAAERITPATLATWVEIFLLNEKIMGDFSHVGSYIGCLASAEVGNEEYKQAEARMSKFGAIYAKSFASVMAALKAVDDETFAALTQRPELEETGFYLSRLRRNAIKSMSPEMEVLTAELGVDGMSAWGRLYSEASGRLFFDLPDADGGAPKSTPMAMKVSLLESPDSSTREAVLKNSNTAWDDISYVTASALNAIAGTRLTLYGKRGYTDFLEKPLHDAAVSPETISAMWEAVESNRTVVQSYLKKKAELLGKPALGFADLSCPLPQGAGKTYSWDEGVDLVLRAFNARYPALGAFAESMISNNRVDSEQRNDKRPGAYCSGTLKNRESRVFMNYGGGLGDISTLAHELGHAFHNFVMKEKRPMAARFPMTLAETASTFAERILQIELLEDPHASKEDKLQVLTTRLNDASVFLCNIPMRFVFEKNFYTERQNGEVSVSRLKELMTEAQRECYDDALDADRLDPLFWASKMHFYITGVSFYNFPYTFGYLFSLGLAADVGERGADGMRQYEELLKFTGSDTCEGVAKSTLGIDLTDTAFWERAIDQIRDDYEYFQQLLDAD